MEREKRIMYEVDRDYELDYNHVIFRLIRLSDNAILAAHGSRTRMLDEIEKRNINELTIWR